MKLSEHFTLAEFTADSTAQRMGIDNTPPVELLPRLVRVAEMLERVRSTLDAPVNVIAGFRCPVLNRAVGGTTSIDHTQGHAADIVAPSYGTPYQIARLLAPLVSTLGIGQLILEGVKGQQWVHLSTHTPERACDRVITITDAGTQLGVRDLA